MNRISPPDAGNDFLGPLIRPAFLLRTSMNSIKPTDAFIKEFSPPIPKKVTGLQWCEKIFKDILSFGQSESKKDTQYVDKKR